MTNSLGSGAGKLIAGALYYFILILISITALNQTGIDTSLISNNLILMIGVLLLAGGLAYAYAARDIMRNMLSSFFGKSNFREGQRIRLDTIEGTILKIDKISVTIDSDGKKVVIPSAELLNNRVVIIEDARTTES
jgi:small-conductance mechanosensitive channel